jgi:hypothetical protein
MTFESFDFFIFLYLVYYIIIKYTKPFRLGLAELGWVKNDLKSLYPYFLYGHGFGWPIMGQQAGPFFLFFYELVWTQPNHLDWTETGPA